MALTIAVNGLGLSHKGSNGFSVATIPDVCKTPTPGGPVPIPYPNIAFSKNLTKGTKTVKVDGGNMAAVKGSQYSTSFGDEPGTVGGIKSSTFKKETDWITYSFDVKMDGKNACRLTDKKFHNHKNTVDLAGDFEGMIAVAEFERILSDCAKQAEEEVNQRNYGGPPTKERCEKEIEFEGERMKTKQALGIIKGREAEACVAAKMEELGRADEASIQQPYKGSVGNGTLATDGPPNPPYNPAGSQVPDVVLHDAGNPTDVREVYDFKFPCPPSAKKNQWFTKPGQPTQGERYFSAFGRKPHIVSPGRGVSCPPLRNPAFG
ncbi:MAG: DUF4150 domain-containing protein [Kiloniellales bacterium]|nr:DUF4150 domain-containing protein [Kiloniellales bacterium]